MTAIACDLRSMAGDRRLYDGTCRSQVVKVHRLPDGSVVGLFGTFAQCWDLLAWIQGTWEDDEPPTVDEAGALHLRADGIWLYDGHPRAFPLAAPYAAFGSGAAAATGVLFEGGTPGRAVEAAARTDPYTGDGIDVLDLQGGSHGD